MKSLKYQFYTSIRKSSDEKLISAQTVNDYIQLYPFFAYKDYNVFARYNFNQYSRYFLKRAFDLVVSTFVLITGFPFFLHFFSL